MTSPAIDSPDTKWPASVCVYCGSNAGEHPEYAVAARELGALLAGRGIRLVFGGGSVGLMGILADAVLAGGGQVTGVIPHGLRTRELAHEGVSEMIAVDSMHARKQRMVDLSDAFIALPGGIGTMDELFETFTWLQLGIHSKPIGLLNVIGYYEPLISLLGQMCDKGFLGRAHLENLLVDDNARRLLDRVCSCVVPAGRRRLASGRLQP